MERPGAGIVIDEDVGDQQLLGAVVVDMGTHYCVTADAAVLVHLLLCTLVVKPNLDPLVIGIPGLRHEEQEQTNVAATLVEFGTIICLTRVDSEAQGHLEARNLVGGLVPDWRRAHVHHAVDLRAVAPVRHELLPLLAREHLPLLVGRVRTACMDTEVSRGDDLMEADFLWAVAPRYELDIEGEGRSGGDARKQVDDGQQRDYTERQEHGE
ncbi:hypothetical protein BS78_06G012500 [Paspalum vaginatum]|nr:hypothetical protein BS78_06G012500 [Paspalum vaginatum]